MVHDTRKRASHHFSLVSTRAYIWSRNRLQVAICSSVASIASGEMIFISFLPDIEWVKDKLGPWPGSPGLAHRQLGFPHRRNRSTSVPGRVLPDVLESHLQFCALCSTS